MSVFRKHPVAAPAVLTTAIVALFLLVPVSFDRTVGHDVSLTLSGFDPGEGGLSALASELKSQLRADRVGVRAMMDGNAGPSYTLSSYVPGRSDANALSVLQAFERTLEEKGFAVSFSSTPRVERVSSTVAAYAADQVIRIQSEGKSAAEIEAEIRNGLAAAGFPDAEVSVTDTPEGQRDVRVRVERQSEGDSPSDDLETEMPAIEIDGQQGDQQGERCKVAVRKMQDESGATSLTMDVEAQGREATVTVPGVESMSDASLEAEIERQLGAAGLNLDVRVSNGRIEVLTGE